MMLCFAVPTYTDLYGVPVPYRTEVRKRTITQVPPSMHVSIYLRKYDIALFLLYSPRNRHHCW